MSESSMPIRIGRVSTPSQARHARALLLDYVEWIRAAAGIDPLVAQPDFAVELAHLENRYGRGDATLFMAWQDDLPLGTVAVRCHDDGTAELKRMYVRPVARGRGVGKKLLSEALAVAASSGSRLMWLETLRGVMDPAIALYRRHGFVEVSGERRTVDADGIVLMERPLTSEVPSAVAAA